MRTMSRWYGRHFLLAEFGVAGLVGLGFAVWSSRFNGFVLVQGTLNGNRSAIYGALASISGSLLGFTITAVSIILGFSASGRLVIVRNSPHYRTLGKIFTSSMRSLALATILSLLALIFDRDSAPVPILLYLCAWAATLAVLRLLRCLWVFEKIIGLIIAPSKERSGDKA